MDGDSVDALIVSELGGRGRWCASFGEGVGVIIGETGRFSPRSGEEP